MTTPPEELRQAAFLLSNLNLRPELAAAVDLPYTEPLAKWLEVSAVVHLPDNECGFCDRQRNPTGLPCPSLAVARAINGEQQ